MTAVADCPDDCAARFISGLSDQGPGRAAPECPVRSKRGRWGWPCHRSMADVRANDAGSHGNNLATLAQQ